jgi:hypothetical protein
VATAAGGALGHGRASARRGPDLERAGRISPCASRPRSSRPPRSVT